MDWVKAKKYLDDTRKIYAEIGVAGIPAMRAVLDPLLVRFEKGERTQELYDEMMSVE